VPSRSELLPHANFCFCFSIVPSIHLLRPPSAQSLRAFSNLSISARIVAISMASTSQKLPSRREGNLLYVGMVVSSSSHRCQTISVGADGSEFPGIHGGRGEGGGTPGEGGWLLDVQVQLFDHYFVGPAEAKKQRDALNAKVAEAKKSPLRKAFSGSHAVCTAYHVLRSLKLPTAALQVVESTFS